MLAALAMEDSRSRLVHGRRAVNQPALTKANRRNEVNQAHVKELIATAFHFEGDVLGADSRASGRQTRGGFASESAGQPLTSVM